MRIAILHCKCGVKHLQDMSPNSCFLRVIMIMLCAQGVFLKEDWEWQGLDKYEFARFGSTIATVGDLDGNRYNDVAIGAPLEEDSESGRSGSIYIYNGIPGGIMHEFTQVSLWR